MKKKQLFTLDNTPTKCPFCGNEYQQIVYYTADSEITGSYSTYSGNVKTTHTEYNYTNIQKKTGGMCVGCLTDREKHNRKMGWIILLSGIPLTGICFGILFLLNDIFFEVPRFLAFAPLIPLISCAFVSYAFFPEFENKKHYGKKFQRMQGSERYEYLSNKFIAMAAEYYPETSYLTERGLLELEAINALKTRSKDSSPEVVE
jgi:hypothetical protein